MTNRSINIGLIGALGVAAIAIVLWQGTRLRHLTDENARLRAQIAQLPARQAQSAELPSLPEDTNALAELLNERERMKLELARLRNMAGVARRAESEAAQLRMDLIRQPAEAGTNSISGPMGDLMRTTLNQQAKGQLARLRAKVNLTPDQAEAIERILERQMQQMSSAMQKVFAGKLGKEDMADLRQGQFNPEQEIQALLSPEQQALYQEYKQEEAASNARLAANMEVMQLQGSLGLNQEQQDQVFSVLYDQTLRQVQGGTTVPKGGTSGDIMQAMLAQKLKALEGVLSADQLQTYRQQQETQLKFIQSITAQAEAATGEK
jgi:hypothetical protein